MTGSTRGIGKSIAEELARAGAKVAISQPQGRRPASGAGRVREAGLRGPGAALQRLAQGGAAGAGGRDARRNGARIDIVVGQRRHQPVLRAAHRHLRRRLRQDRRQQPEERAVARRHDPARHGGAGRAAASSWSARSAASSPTPSSAPTACRRPPTTTWCATWPPNGGRRTCASTPSRPGLVKTEFARALWEDEKRAARAHCKHAAAPPGRAARHRRHRGVPRLATPRLSSPDRCIVADGGVTIL